MEQKAYIAGVGMTPFGNAIDQSLSQLAGAAIQQALRDADIEASELNAAYMGNGAAAVITGQVCVPGQVVLRNMGIGRIPVINVENACATSATAFQQAATMISLGVYDVVLAGISRSLFIDIYATWAREHMHQYGTTREQLAAVSAKNSIHGSLNPLSQFRHRITAEEVLSARAIVDPLTLPMCAPIGDGAAALVMVSEKKARELGMSRCVRVRASSLHSGWDRVDDEPEMVPQAAEAIYQQAGIGADDIDCVELHDASAISSP